MKQDSAIQHLIAEEYNRQFRGVELIASENFVSEQVMAAAGSCLTNKYAEGYPGKRYYGGCEVVDQVEQLAIDRAKELFGAAWVNVQPHSGSSANIAVYYALLQKGDTVMGMSLDMGGHLTHGSPVNFSGIDYKIVAYPIDGVTGLLDYELIRNLALEHKPKMIIAGASAYSRTIDFEKFRAIADEVGAYLMADIAHIAGLVAAGEHPSPVPHAHVVTSTTHKTLRGPRSGIIMSNDLEIGAKIDKMIFPGLQGGPLEHIIAAKAVSFYECLQPEFKTYMKQVKANAAALSNAFIAMGYDVVSGGTDNHLFVLDLRKKGIKGNKASNTLDKADITVSKSTIPNDTEKPWVTSGIRIGASAISTRGLKEADCAKIATWIDRALSNPDSPEVLEAIKAEVNAYMQAFPLFAW